MPEALLSSPASSDSLNRGGTFELLCACSSAKPGPKEIARIAGCQFADFGWEEFLRVAEHHGVAALAARNLIEHASALPSEIRRSLESAYAANLRRGLWFAAELMRIMQHFAQKQVRAIPYKGPVLAQSAYSDLALRSFSDLDLLISPVDFARAREVLAEIGYQPSKQLTPAVERLWLRTGYERSFDGPGGKNVLELQWALLPYFYAVDPEYFRFDDLWARAGRIRLDGEEVPVQNQIAQAAAQASLGGNADVSLPSLSPEDSLLVLCLHAAKHLWTRLIWIADISQTLRMPGIDLALVIARARSLGIVRILGLSVWLAHHLLGAAIPSTAQEIIDGDPQIPRLGEECAARLARCASYGLESTEYFRQMRHLRERRSDRCRYLWRLVWTPGPGDVEAVALPEFLFRLYRGVRIGRIVQKLVRSNY